MKNSFKVSMILMSVACASILIAFEALNANKPSLKVAASRPRHTTNITQEMLQNTVLEDWDIKKNGLIDKKFRIQLPKGKYIDGAIIFNDVSGQTCGPTLADALMHDNTQGTETKPYNFNVLFSLENTVKLVTNFKMKCNRADSGECLYFQTKFALYSEDHDRTKFYEEIEDNYTYTAVTSTCNAEGSNYYYGDSSAYTSDWSNIDAVEKDISVEWDVYRSLRVAAIQFTSRYSGGNIVHAGDWLSCTLTSLSLTYECDE